MIERDSKTPLIRETNVPSTKASSEFPVQAKSVVEELNPAIRPYQLRMAELARRSARESPKVTEQRTGKNNVFALNVSPASHAALMETFGTIDSDLTKQLFTQLLSVSPQRADVGEANAIMAALHGIHPRDELEGLLATQMVSVHNLAMEFMRRAALRGQTVDGVDVNTSRMVKLLRTFMQQIDALNRYRNRGQQQVTVQHVQVNGGQAIVGTVQSQGGGISGKN